MTGDRKQRLPHFKELDGIRGLAAVAVFVHHFLQLSTSSQPSVVRSAAAYGLLGVQVFFVLSGFLITSLLFVDRDDPYLLHNFYWKRVLRIWPVLIVHVLLYILLFPGPGSNKYALLAVLFVANFASRFGAGVGPAWTLSIEEQFYLAWPHLIRRCRMSTVFWVACAIALLSAGLRIAVPLLRHGAIDVAYTFYQLDGLALGAILSCQWYAPSSIGPWMRAVVRLLNGAWGLGLGLSVAALTYEMHPGNLKISLAMLATNFFTYRVLAAIVLSPKGEVASLSWLKTRPMRFLGEVSYGLYMYHGFLLVPIERHYGAPNLDHPWLVLARFICSLAACLLICYASLRFMELPIRKLRRYTTKRAPHQDALGNLP